jgi:hypothetical protein
MSQNEPQDDPALAPLLALVRADPSSEGLLLSGSRGAGMQDEASDYDLVWVLTDAAFDERQRRGEPLHLHAHPLDPRLDVSWTCLRELTALAARGGWELPAYATAVTLYDRQGKLALVLRDLVTMPEERARADVLAWFDAYLNAFYRSLKAWRRGNELGARLQAAESAMHLVRVLFALERRWPPYHDRLVVQLPLLDGQGWPPGYLAAALLRLVETGAPTLQQELERQVEALLYARGFAPDLWGDEIAQLKAWQF